VTTVFDCVLVLPTWLLYRLLMVKAPADHPWQGKDFSLAQWSRGATAFCRKFAAALWAAAALVAYTVFDIWVP
jgi:hypothetical protein